MSGIASSSAGAAPTAPTVQEFSVRVRKSDKPMAIMRFNGALNVDIAKWANVKMVRDDHSSKPKIASGPDPAEEEPKFGAGSEYGREAREEARRRKYGGRIKKVNAKDQPWVLKAVTTEKQTKRFKGLREGTISENTSYFVFTQATDGQFEAFPVAQWYNFTPIQTYKRLTVEEAEEEFGRRDKIMNYFNVMLRKKVKGDEGDDGDKDDEKLSKRGKGGKAKGDLKVSEMEDWEDMHENESEEDEDDDEGDEKYKGKAKKPGKKGKGKKKGSGSEAEEDSDDGDGEGRELDYFSDTSVTSSEDEGEERRKDEDLVGVDQESGLRDLLESGSDEEEEKKDTKDAEEEDDNDKPKKAPKVKKHKKKTENKSGDNLSDDSDIEDEGEESDPTKSGVPSDKEKPMAMEIADASDDRKRKAKDAAVSSQVTKKPKMEIDPTLMQTATAEGITEDAVRRYLHRKPMTASELLQKFKSKKAKVSSEDLVPIIASILKKINPEKRTQNGKMYLYLKN